jgi:hypothetical protein
LIAGRRRFGMPRGRQKEERRLVFAASVWRWSSTARTRSRWL